MVADGNHPLHPTPNSNRILLPSSPHFVLLDYEFWRLLWSQQGLRSPSPSLTPTSGVPERCHPPNLTPSILLNTYTPLFGNGNHFSHFEMSNPLWKSLPFFTTCLVNLWDAALAPYTAPALNTIETSFKSLFSQRQVHDHHRLNAPPPSSKFHGFEDWCQNIDICSRDFLAFCFPCMICFPTKMPHWIQ